MYQENPQEGKRIRVINTTANSPVAGGGLQRLLMEAKERMVAALGKERNVSDLPSVEQLIADQQNAERSLQESQQRLSTIREYTYTLAHEYTRGMQSLAEELYANGNHRLDITSFPPVYVSTDHTVDSEGALEYPLEVRYFLTGEELGSTRMQRYKQSLHRGERIDNETPQLYVHFDKEGNFQSIVVAVERLYAGNIDKTGNTVSNNERIDSLSKTKGSILQQLLENIDSTLYTNEAFFASVLGTGGLGVSIDFKDFQGRPEIHFFRGRTPGGLRVETSYVYNPDSDNFELEEGNKGLIGTRRSFTKRKQKLPDVLLSAEDYPELITQLFSLIPSEVLA